MSHGKASVISVLESLQHNLNQSQIFLGSLVVVVVQTIDTYAPSGHDHAPTGEPFVVEDTFPARIKLLSSMLFALLFHAVCLLLSTGSITEVMLWILCTLLIELGPYPPKTKQ